ncbi:hypothetical protein A3D00_03805 [Candidatus Woesebacteria bacterium RIFCSPHIGHO2_02_FULL_38_9]|uniref:GIY-YIG domain-containing protein n=1 Tax=Candidatus Woesebacteria bacterium RIFCSPHIGHO2_01_FULL_39_28 TaxID=1802496 RepID=A0A1F7YDN1_9BACT|nr:MAG: hypothetical protein A2627_05020 [Candidatus Woesebacteria bacterium RIFCSPHIGHO2_01_FULL_39_28]OGM33956.1 MAG: hypothetical protein A3D00_03805 [Candidatus Woesebacteria bacterium RIFCSPHIGHO2_02_FULL_38_9]OGM57555.1 MAG: hypothetical protein A3A50_06135 [Candidatus Woesebacteria bacterium RIFCSPLOWO2_01_FULL_38_20]
MYYTYILKSVNYSKTYTGITNNLTRRLNQHNNGYQFYTRKYKPWVMIHSEILGNRIEARKREKYFKSCAGRKWIKKSFFPN